MRLAQRCLLLSCLCLGAWALDWPGYRGPEMSGSTSASDLPTSWSSTENRLWSQALPGPGASQPITRDGRIYVTCYSGYGESRSRRDTELLDMSKLCLHVLCLDADDGRQIWRKDLEPHAVFEPIPIIKDHGYATPTPVIDNDSLYVSFGNAGVFALDAASGSVRWQLVPGEILHRWGCAASLSICDDLLMVNASPEVNALIAVDKHTGKERWRSSEAMITDNKYNRSWSTPMVANRPEGGKQILLLNLDTLCAYNPADGSILWTYPTRQGYSASNPVVHDGTCYALVGSGHGNSSSHALRLDADLDRKERAIWSTDDEGTGFSSAVYVDGRLYYAALFGKERPACAKGFCCMDAETGEMIYKQTVDDSLGKRGGERVWAAATAGDGKIYYVSQTRGIYVLAASDTCELLAVNSFEDDDSYFQAPVVPLGNGRLLLRSNWGLHCVGSK